MPITRLNHAVLYVRDVATTREFYENVLGFRTLTFVDGTMAFFQAPGSTTDHDPGTFTIRSAPAPPAPGPFQLAPDAAPSAAGRGMVGLYPSAWEVDTLAELQRLAGVLSERGAL